MEAEIGSVDTPLPAPDENHTQADFIQNELNFDVDPNDPLTKASLSDHPVNEWMDILGNGQLRKKVLKPGKDNTRPNRSDICTIKLLGKLEDGTVVEEEDNLTVQLGDMEVIQGLDLALALMDTEEEAEIEVNARFAYGSIGRSPISQFPEIPPNTDLRYFVVLKSVQMEPDIDELSCSEKRKIGNKKRERGNWWFGRDECTLAIQCYRKALQYLTPSSESDINDEKNKNVEEVSDAELQEMLEDALKVHNNLAAAQLKCEAYDAALQSVENVLRCQPQNVKALFRKGKILHYKGEHANACAVLAQALKLEPNNKAVQQELLILKKKNADDARHEKNLYRKMLGTSKNDKKQNDKNSTNNNKKSPAKLTWSLLGGTVVAVAGIIVYRLLA